MRSVETDWWVIDLPDEWEAEQDEETIVIGDEDGVGALEITTLEKSDDTGEPADIHELAQALVPSDVIGSAVRLGEFSGLYFEYTDEGDAVREWLLRCDRLLLLVSYSCDIDNRGFDDAMVDEILETLRPVPGSEA